MLNIVGLNKLNSKFHSNKSQHALFAWNRFREFIYQSRTCRTSIRKMCGSWTKLNEETALYSGTVRNIHTFQYDAESSNNWKLILGDVRESARVWLNGEYQGGL